ncbi:hypothetical protein MTO96_002521 [Rhipicephalus appendiculatus]
MFHRSHVDLCSERSPLYRSRDKVIVCLLYNFALSFLPPVLPATTRAPPFLPVRPEFGEAASPSPPTSPCRGYPSHPQRRLASSHTVRWPRPPGLARLRAVPLDGSRTFEEGR